MYSNIHTAVLHGIEAVPVQVEADAADGMPRFEMVGLLSSEVREARERVAAALRNSGYRLSAKKITVNLTPANIRKSGNSCDLPVAAAVLAAFGYLPDELLSSWLLIGEVGLDGSVLPVQGVLACAILAKSMGLKGVIVPESNAEEAAVYPEIRVIALKSIRHLAELCSCCLPESGCYQGKPPVCNPPSYSVDFAEISGQEELKRACEIAAAGMHNLLIIGAPGSGKTMAASRMPTILPELTLQEKLEISRIYSACGLLGTRDILCSERPFRAPHHTVTPQALAGGGLPPRPGEISLAHHGVLFLDELTEFSPQTLEVLREPLEDKQIRISRLGVSVTYPADFILLAAMNPCRCGYYPDLNRCTCTAADLQRYRSRISRPLLDRMDLCVESQPISFRDLAKQPSGEPSAAIRKRVKTVQRIQAERYADCGFQFNSQIPASKIRWFCHLPDQLNRWLEERYREYGLSARGYCKVLRTARTIADLDGSGEICRSHLEEALYFRAADTNYWNLAGGYR
jgi:magnesium chelatase family protein